VFEASVLEEAPEAKVEERDEARRLKLHVGEVVHAVSVEGEDASRHPSRAPRSGDVGPESVSAVPRESQ
jgi:hypothetical protein